MPYSKAPLQSPRPLSIPQLETGLRLLGRGDCNHHAFWDEHVEAFRQTVLFAIRETSDALLSHSVPLQWRAELVSQLEELVDYIELADRYIARRSSRLPSGSASPLGRFH